MFIVISNRGKTEDDLANPPVCNGIIQGMVVMFLPGDQQKRRRLPPNL